MSGQSTEAAGDGPRRVRLLLEYDGSGYAGWQSQPDVATVQDAVVGALRRVLDDQRACVVAAGRTDAGVHAAGQVAHLQTSSRRPLDAIRSGGNALLPRDIRIRAASEAPAGFHARFDAAWREYRYQIYNRRPVPPFLERYAWSWDQRLDVAAMDAAARLFVGSHDLGAFRGADCTAPSSVRTVTHSQVASHGRLLVFSIRAISFLQHMVRIIAGTLLDVGRGRCQLEDIRRLIDRPVRGSAPPTAPARGLFLVRVGYPGEPEVAPAADPVVSFSPYNG